MAPDRLRHVPTSIAFWLVVYVFAMGMLGTTLPTPLYVLYQASWHFSEGIVTVIYASYAAGVMLTLLFAGRSSDQVGRRPVLGIALASSTVSTIVFIVAPGLGLLFVGRVLSGLAAGLITGTATAALTDLAGPSGGRRASLASTAANMGGLGLGPLVAGLFAEYGPNPTVLVFEVYLGLLAVGAVFLLVSPETVEQKSRLTYRFRGLGIPSKGRGEFLAASLAGFSAFALLGLFSSLAPSFLATVLHEDNRAVAGAVVFLIFAAATVTQMALSRVASRTVMLAGLCIFPPALALIVGGLSQASFALFLVGTATGGVAAGCLFLGSLSTANRLAPTATRSQVVSTYFLFAYIGLTIPVIAVGVSSQHIGDFRATLFCAIVLAVLCLCSGIAIMRARTPEPAA
jgi:MFS family permease